jgi:hypothetical protein
LSVLDISKREEIEKIWTKTNPSELFGASPNALTFGADDDELLLRMEPIMQSLLSSSSRSSAEPANYKD